MKDRSRTAYLKYYYYSPAIKNLLSLPLFLRSAVVGNWNHTYPATDNNNNNSRLEQPKTTFVSIVWHLRVVDIVLNARKNYFLSIAAQIALVFQQQQQKQQVVVQPVVDFAGKDGKDIIISQHLPFFDDDICLDVFNNSCYQVFHQQE